MHRDAMEWTALRLYFIAYAGPVTRQFRENTTIIRLVKEPIEADGCYGYGINHFMAATLSPFSLSSAASGFSRDVGQPSSAGRRIVLSAPAPMVALSTSRLVWRAMSGISLRKVVD